MAANLVKMSSRARYLSVMNFNNNGNLSKSLGSVWQGLSIVFSQAFRSSETSRTIANTQRPAFGAVPFDLRSFAAIETHCCSFRAEENHWQHYTTTTLGYGDRFVLGQVPQIWSASLQPGVRAKKRL